MFQVKPNFYYEKNKSNKPIKRFGLIPGIPNELMPRLKLVFSIKHRCQMLKGTVLFIVSGASLYTEIIAYHFRCIPFIISEKSIQYILFILRKLIPCRFKPRHVFLSLQISLFHKINFIKAVYDSFLTCLWVMRSRETAQFWRSKPNYLRSFCLYLIIRIPDDKIHVLLFQGLFHTHHNLPSALHALDN